MINGERIAAFALLVVLVVSWWVFSSPPRSVDNENAIPTTSSFGWVAGKDEPSGTLTIKTTKPIPAGSTLSLDIRDNNLYETPEQTAARDKAGVRATLTRPRRFISFARDFPFTDFGTFAGATNGSPPADFSGFDDYRCVVGLRFSPVRVMFDTVAADILAAPHYAGFGVSAYIPPDLAGPAFRHWGIGAGYLWGFDSRESGTVVYLSFTTKVP